MPVFPKRKISGWIKQVADKYQRQIGDVTFIFCSEKKIIEINRQYLNHDCFTDIITFDYTDKTKISGDLFICIETVRSNAYKYNAFFTDELYRVMIHGILHLCGIDDKSAKERKHMKYCEDKALTSLVSLIGNNNYT